MRGCPAHDRSVNPLPVLLGWLLSAQASAQTGFGGGSSNVPSWLVGLDMVAGLIFAALVLAGLFSSLQALLGHRTLEAGRRRVLRLIGLNWLEPAITLLVTTCTLLALKPSEQMLPLVLIGVPLLGFATMMLPAFFVPVGADTGAGAALITLRFSAVLRIASAALAFVLTPLLFVPKVPSLLSAALVHAAGALGLGVLMWSVLRLGRHATVLSGREHDVNHSGF
jgi:hypothetical protein